MSREAREWAWDKSPIEDPRQLLILLSLADVADEHGKNAYPSVHRLARDCRSNPRTVQRHLTAMVKEGILRVEQKSTQHRPTTYMIAAMDEGPRGDSLTPLDGPAVTQERLRGDSGVTNPDSPPIDRTGSGIGIEARETRVACDATTGFQDFWDAYPKRNGRRLGRAKCEVRWKKLDLDTRRAAWRGARHYCADVDAGLQIAKDPERWLRDRCWEEWQEPSKPGVVRKAIARDAGRSFTEGLFNQAQARKAAAV